MLYNSDEDSNSSIRKTSLSTEVMRFGVIQDSKIDKSADNINLLKIILVNKWEKRKNNKIWQYSSSMPDKKLEGTPCSAFNVQYKYKYW